MVNESTPAEEIEAERDIETQREESEPVVQPAGTQAATVAQPAQPEEAGPGVLHEDGSVAPVQGEAPNIGGTEHVQ